MARYRKRPVEVEAMQITAQTWRAVRDWSGAEVVKAASGRGVAFLLLRTFEGRIRADFGDWIIRNAKGEYSRCSNEAFEATYEPVQRTLPSTFSELDDE